MRAIVFDKLLCAIGDYKRLFIAPDGELTRVPFEVLSFDAVGNHQLIDDYLISYVTTGRDLIRFNDLQKRLARDPVVAANPNFNLTSNVSTTKNPSDHQSRDWRFNGDQFRSLSGTKEEGEFIAGKLKVKGWFEDDVLESTLKFYESPSILHIATHGFFFPNQVSDPNKKRTNLETYGLGTSDEIATRLFGRNLENPMLRSGLALAGANTWLKHGSLPENAEDGILTAEDVSGMNLLNTNLVVLSACETGLGDMRNGEGVFGLRRAFVLAGSQTLVMSLWKVPDYQTKELMKDFYKQLLECKEETARKYKSNE